MNDEFVNALKTHQSAFGIELADKSLAALAKYYEIIVENNAILHLTAPMEAEEFAIRHILESLTMLDHLPLNARFADVGAGAGLPSMPCLLARDDLRAVLIESKVKKAKFLESAVDGLGLADRAKIVNHQFEETEAGHCQFVTCRALDKFTEKLPRLLKWSGKRSLLFFGGRNLGGELTRQKVKFYQKLMPMSEQRYLFISKG